MNRRIMRGMAELLSSVLGASVFRKEEEWDALGNTMLIVSGSGNATPETMFGEFLFQLKNKGITFADKEGVSYLQQNAEFKRLWEACYQVTRVLS